MIMGDVMFNLKRLIIFCIIFAIIFTSTTFTAFGENLKIIFIKNMNIEIVQNQKYSLPQKVEAFMSNNTIKDVEVLWDKSTINTGKTGSYIYKGTVSGYIPKVIATIDVISSKADKPIYVETQEEKNLKFMLTSCASDNSYWSYFTDTERYPSYIYMDNYFSTNSSSSLLNDHSLFFNVNIPASYIGLADKIYKDEAVKTQAQERAKQVLLSLIIRDGNKWMQYSLKESENEFEEILLHSLKSIVLGDSVAFNGFFKNDYSKIDEALSTIRMEIDEAKKNGVQPSLDSILYSNAVRNLKIKSLSAKLGKDIDYYYSQRLKNLEFLTKKLGIYLDLTNLKSLGTDGINEVCDFLQSCSDFIDFLAYIEENSNTKEISNAAHELKNYYLDYLSGKISLLNQGKADGTSSIVNDFITEASYQAAFAQFTAYASPDWDKINAFEKLRFSSLMGMTIANYMKYHMNLYFNSSNNSDQKNEVDAIYKIAPFLFSLRLDGETYLSRYLNIIGQSDKDSKQNLDNMIGKIKLLNGVFYKDIAEIAIDLKDNNIQGNTPGNISNKGITAMQGEWVYFANCLDQNRLYQIKKDGSNRSKLCDDSCQNINVVGHWIYYGNLRENNKIYKIRTDGTARTMVCDDEGDYINVVGNWIYYCNSTDNSSLYKIKTDGSERTKICNDKCKYLNIVGEWAYYSNSSDNKKLYKVRLDGSERTKLCDQACSDINVVGDWVFYTKVGKYFEKDYESYFGEGYGSINYYPTGEGIYKIKTDGSCSTMLSDQGSSINVVGEWIYYVDGDLSKMKTDGSGRIKLGNGAIKINILEDWVYLSNGSYEHFFLDKIIRGYLYKVRTDGYGYTVA